MDGGVGEGADFGGEVGEGFEGEVLIESVVNLSIPLDGCG